MYINYIIILIFTVLFHVVETVSSIWTSVRWCLKINFCSYLRTVHGVRFGTLGNVTVWFVLSSRQSDTTSVSPSFEWILAFKWTLFQQRSIYFSSWRFTICPKLHTWNRSEHRIYRTTVWCKENSSVEGNTLCTWLSIRIHQHFQISLLGRAFGHQEILSYFTMHIYVSATSNL